jgi:DNA-binding transcriptional MerR regulator
VRIGELADQASISTKAIRYYEQVGILAPPARTASGYRTYDQAALGRLGFVRAAQAVGLTLGEIRQVIASRDNGQTPLRACHRPAAAPCRRPGRADPGAPAAAWRAAAVGRAGRHP